MMPLFTIDAAKCRRDGACVAECPRLLLTMPGNNEVPVPVPDAEELCIDCGHCVAVCPHGALTLRSAAPGDLPTIQTTYAVPPADLVTHLKARRSVRAFARREVPPSILEQLLDTARCAPTASNRQRVHWVVEQNPAEVHRLAGMVMDWIRQRVQAGDPVAIAGRQDRMLVAWDRGVDYICRGAPHLVIAHGPRDWGQTDGAIALTYLEVLAPSFGVGACWAGFLTGAANQYEPLRRELALPERHVVAGALMLGYPVHRFHRIPNRQPLKVQWR
jgi:nitroreductase/NAD-dependent dihydropyrimidine dehydrogenase PreA subunit